MARRKLIPISTAEVDEFIDTLMGIINGMYCTVEVLLLLCSAAAYGKYKHIPRKGMGCSLQ